MTNKRNNQGVSEVLSTIVSLSIAATVVAGVMVWAIPQMENTKAAYRIQSISNQLLYLNQGVRQLVAEGEGASTSSTVNFDQGTLNIQSDEGTRFVVYYTVNSDEDYLFEVSGLNPEGPVYDPETFIVRFLNAFPKTSLIVRMYEPIQGTQIGADITITLPSWIPPVSVDTGEQIMGTIRIDLYGVSTPTPEVLFGQIYVFDVGSLNYENTVGSNQVNMLLENGGVLPVDGNGNSNLNEGPKCYYNTQEHHLVLSFIQLKPESDYSLGGAGGIFARFQMKLTHKKVLANNINLPQTTSQEIHMQVHGAGHDAWLTYYQDYLGGTLGGDDTLSLDVSKFALILNEISFRVYQYV